jgi:hypothetical protein
MDNVQKSSFNSNNVLTCISLEGKTKRKRALGSLGLMLVDNIQMDLKKTKWGDTDNVDVARNVDQQAAFVNTVMSLQIRLKRSEILELCN